MTEQFFVEGNEINREITWRLISRVSSTACLRTVIIFRISSFVSIFVQSICWEFVDRKGNADGLAIFQKNIHYFTNQLIFFFMSCVKNRKNQTHWQLCNIV